MRPILHVDLDAFFVSVERVLNPRLVGLPVVVGGSPDGRGVVAAASYEARAFGVRSAMPMARAVRLCPQLVRVRGSRDMYRRASKAVFAILGEYTDLIERMSIDEAYLDLSPSKLWATRPFDAAQRMQREVKHRLRLDLSVGVATSRLLAKVASGLAKPCGVLLVQAGQEARVLAPLPVRSLPGIGPVTARHLEAQGVRTLGELVRSEVDVLRAAGVNRPKRLQARARGEDSSPVRPASAKGPPKSISHEETFARDRSDVAFLEDEIRRLMRACFERMQSYGLRARTVSIKLRNGDFSTRTRDFTLPDATHLEFELVRAALELFWREQSPYEAFRLVGVKLSGFEQGLWQPRLFNPEPAAAAKPMPRLQSVQKS